MSFWAPALERKDAVMNKVSPQSRSAASAAPGHSPNSLHSAQALNPGAARILVVDDDTMMRDLMARSLLRLGFQVVTVADGPSALSLLQHERFDLVMLDVVMPDMDGFEVCDAMRNISDVPIIMLTALSRTDDMVRAIRLGADGYITKPFNFKETEARVRAVLRRSAHLQQGSAFQVAEYGDLHLDNSQQEATLRGETLQLAPIEFSLLRYLAAHSERPISKEELLREVWGYDETVNHNIVELAVRRLRMRIEEDPAHPQRIVTVRSVGYRYCIIEPVAPPQKRPSSATKRQNTSERMRATIAGNRSSK